MKKLLAAVALAALSTALPATAPAAGPPTNNTRKSTDTGVAAPAPTADTANWADTKPTTATTAAAADTNLLNRPVIKPSLRRKGSTTPRTGSDRTGQACHSPPSTYDHRAHRNPRNLTSTPDSRQPVTPIPGGADGTLRRRPRAGPGHPQARRAP